MTQKQKKYLFTLISIVLVIIINLICGELVIRIYNASNQKAKKIWIPDPYMGFIHSSNNKFIFKSAEFVEEQRTNDFGLVGRQRSLKKPDDVFRILVMGDSFAEALQIQEDKNFSERLEQKLNASDVLKGKKFEVLNAGVSGYAPIMHYQHFKKRLYKLKPDLVIVQMWTNDIYEDTKVAAMSHLDDKGLPLKVNRYFTKKYIDKTKNFDAEMRFIDQFYGIHSFFMKVSRFYEYMYTWFVKFNKNQYPHNEYTQKPYYNDGNQFFMISSRNELYKDEEYRTLAKANTTLYLSSLRDLVNEHGGDFMFLYVPFEAQLDMKEYSQHSKIYFPSRADSFINEFLFEMSNQQGLTYYDMMPTFQKNVEKGLYIDWDGHLNEVGHEVVAQGLLEYLIDNEVIKN